MQDNWLLLVGGILHQMATADAAPQAQAAWVLWELLSHGSTGHSNLGHVNAVVKVGAPAAVSFRAGLQAEAAGR